MPMWKYMCLCGFGVFASILPSDKLATDSEPVLADIDSHESSAAQPIVRRKATNPDSRPAFDVMPESQQRQDQEAHPVTHEEHRDKIAVAVSADGQPYQMAAIQEQHQSRSQISVDSNGVVSHSNTPAPTPITDHGWLARDWFQETGCDIAPDLDLGSPDTNRYENEINYDRTLQAFRGLHTFDNFAIIWTGELQVDIAGSYTFELMSDDGSHLKVNGNELINNGGCHEVRSKSASIDLVEGRHDMLVDYKAKLGHAGCKLYYKGPDTNDQDKIVPVEKIFRPPMPSTSFHN